mgnify:CR=1 FL=1
MSTILSISFSVSVQTKTNRDGINRKNIVTNMSEFDMYYKINKRNICMILGNHLVNSYSKSSE